MTYKTASVYPHPQALFLWSYLLLLTLSLLLQRQWLPWKHRIDILHAGSFYLLFSLPRTFFPLDNLTACFLIPFGSFPECRWAGLLWPPYLKIHMHVHAQTREHAFCLPPSCFISLRHTYYHPTVTYCTFLSAAPVRTEILTLVVVPLMTGIVCGTNNTCLINRSWMTWMLRMCREKVKDLH